METELQSLSRQIRESEKRLADELDRHLSEELKRQQISGYLEHTMGAFGKWVDHTVQLIDEKMGVGPCRNVLGQTQSDPAGGAQCGRTGRYRADYEYVLCDRCYRKLP